MDDGWSEKVRNLTHSLQTCNTRTQYGHCSEELSRDRIKECMSDDFVKLLQEGRDQLTAGRTSESRDTFLKVVRQSSAVGDRSSLADAFSGLADTESDIGNL